MYKFLNAAKEEFNEERRRWPGWALFLALGILLVTAQVAGLIPQH